MRTTNGKRGGNLVGKPHNDKSGNPVGGIKAQVTDAGGKPVELEGGEVIINKEASKKYWKELSRINQSAGNGVPIEKPIDPHDEDPSEYEEGGKIIEFNRNHLPNKWILAYAKSIKKDHPEIWKLGGNIYGNTAFENLSRVAERGYWLDSEEWMYKKWQSFLARHQHDFRIAGVVAVLKWGGKVNKGWKYMKDLIEDKISKSKAKPKSMKDGGKVEGEIKVGDIVVEFKPNKKYASGYFEGKVKGEVLKFWNTMVQVDFGNDQIEWLPMDYLKKVDSMKEGGSVEGENVVSVSKYILSRHPKKGDTFKGGKVDGFKVARIVKESKNNAIIFKLYLIDSEDKKRVVMYQPKTNKIGDFQKSFLTASKGTYYTTWSDTDKMKEGGSVEFKPEKKGTLIKGSEIIKYAEKVNGNYRLMFYSIKESKGKVPILCDAFDYCKKIDVNNVSPNELIDLIEKNNLMEKGGKLIKRADGSYSKRGLWDNIRDNAGSGKKPTRQMLEQEAKIKAESMRDGGSVGFEDTLFDELAQHNAPSFEDGGEVSSSEYINVLQKVGITEEERENWRELHKVNQRQVRNDKVKEAAEKLKNGTIPQSEYLKIVAKEQPIKLFTEVPALPTAKDIVSALNKLAVSKGIIGYTKHIEDGTKVASRLDIPAYENYDTWVVSVHDGIKEGLIIAYGQTAYLKDVEFKTFPNRALDIATGKEKTTIGRMFGNWENKSPNEVRKMAIKYMNDPNWVQVGMNPFRHSWFYDKKDGMPLVSSSEVIQVGALVLAKNPVKTTPDNDMFIADKKNPSIKFEDGGEVKDEFANTKKLIDEIKKHSFYTKGTISTAKDGSKYRYDSYKLKYPNSANWLVQLFEKASEENTGKSYHTQFNHTDKYSFSYDRARFKGMPHGRMGFKELVLM